MYTYIRSVHTTFEGTYLHTVRSYVLSYESTLYCIYIRRYHFYTYHSYPYLRMYESTSIQATSGNSTLYTYSTAHCTAVHYYFRTSGRKKIGLPPACCLPVCSLRPFLNWQSQITPCQRVRWHPASLRFVISHSIFLKLTTTLSLCRESQGKKRNPRNKSFVRMRPSCPRDLSRKRIYPHRRR